MYSGGVFRFDFRGLTRWLFFRLLDDFDSWAEMMVSSSSFEHFLSLLDGLGLWAPMVSSSTEEEEDAQEWDLRFFLSNVNVSTTDMTILVPKTIGLES
jgi:hypothetical protein